MRRLAKGLVAGLAVMLAAGLLGGCGSAGAPGRTAATGVDGLVVPTPSPDPDDFVAGIDNPYLPLTPGASWGYEVTLSDGGRATSQAVVLVETATVAGVDATVVEESTRDDRGREIAMDRSTYAQDRAGNVWLLARSVTSRTDAGESFSWQAGVAGAEAGLAMPAAPRQGDGFRTGMAAGVAEDRVEVLDVASQVVIALDTFEDVLQIELSSPLRPGVTVQQYYARGVGLVAAEATGGREWRKVLVAKP